MGKTINESRKEWRKSGAWEPFMKGREQNRESKTGDIMKIVEQRPFLDISIGELPDISVLKACRRNPACDGVLIIFDPLDETEE